MKCLTFLAVGFLFNLFAPALEAQLPPSAQPGMSFAPNQARVRGIIVRTAPADVQGVSWARVRIETAEDTGGHRARIASQLSGRTEWLLIPSATDWDAFRTAGKAIDANVTLTVRGPKGPNVFRVVGLPLSPPIQAAPRPIATLTFTVAFAGNEKAMEGIRGTLLASASEWNIEEVTLQEEEGTNGKVWKLDVVADSEGMFRAAGAIRAAGLRSSSMRHAFPEGRVIDERGRFLSASATDVFRFTAQMGDVTDPAPIIAAFAQKGITLYHIAGGIFTGRATRAGILLLARDRRVSSVQLSTRLQPNENP